MSQEPNRSLSSTRQHGLTTSAGRTNTQNQIDPANLPSLPVWLQSRLAMVSKQGWGRPATLPANQALTSREITEIQLHLSVLNGFLEHSSLNHPQTANEVLGLVARLLQALPLKNQSELAGEAKAEAYMIAVEDMPDWAVRQAVREWYRGAYGDEHNYTFAPAPAVLRKLSMIERFKVAGRAKALGELLEAIPTIEYSDEHKADMMRRIADVVADVVKSAT